MKASVSRLTNNQPQDLRLVIHCNCNGSIGVVFQSTSSGIILMPVRVCFGGRFTLNMLHYLALCRGSIFCRGARIVLRFLPLRGELEAVWR